MPTIHSFDVRITPKDKWGRTDILNKSVRPLFPHQELIGAYAGSTEYDPARPDAFYHDQWWITDVERGIYSALGMNGQQLLIHRPSNTVVAKFSTQPGALDTELHTLQDVGLIAHCESLR